MSLTAITWESPPESSWEGGTAYIVGQRVTNPPSIYDAPNVYVVSVGGVSELYGTGPTGTDPAVPITDGTVEWTYLGAWVGSVVDAAPELTGEAGAATFLRMAENMCADANLWGSLLDDGRRYLAAHFGQLARLKGKGMVTAEAVGPLSRSYAALMGSQVFDLTGAGRMYETLARSVACFGSVP